MFVIYTFLVTFAAVGRIRIFDMWPFDFLSARHTLTSKNRMSVDRRIGEMRVDIYIGCHFATCVILI